MDKFDKAIESLQNIVEYWTCRPSEIEAAKLAITVLKQQQEREHGCDYCNPTTSKFEPVFVSDIEENCKWCQKEKCDNYEDSCYGIGYAEVTLNYCPNCGARMEVRNEKLST
jgi:hypothetical protein